MNSKKYSDCSTYDKIAKTIMKFLDANKKLIIFDDLYFTKIIIKKDIIPKYLYIKIIPCDLSKMKTIKTGVDVLFLIYVIRNNYFIYDQLAQPQNKCINMEKKCYSKRCNCKNSSYEKISLKGYKNFSLLQAEYKKTAEYKIRKIFNF